MIRKSGNRFSLATNANAFARRSCLNNRPRRENVVEFAGAMAVAMMVDVALGWPKGLFVLIGHPVTWLGKLIDVLDTRWNRSSDPASLRRAKGVAAALFAIALPVTVAWAIQALLVPAWSRIVLV